MDLCIFAFTVDWDLSGKYFSELLTRSSSELGLTWLLSR